MGRSPHQPARILKVYIETLIGLSHVVSPDGLKSTILFQDYMLGKLPLWEWWAESTFQGQSLTQTLIKATQEKQDPSLKVKSDTLKELISGGCQLMSCK